DTDNATDEIIVIEYTVIVLDIPANIRGETRNNSVTASYDSGVDVTTSAPDVTIVDPELNITKVADPTSGDAGDEITYTITIEHTLDSNAIAYDVQLEDVIPTGVTFNRFGTTTGTAPTTGPTHTTGTITASWDALTTTQSVSIEVIVTIDDDTELNQSINNTAELTNYNSLDDEDATGEDRSPYVTDGTDGERDLSDDDDAEIIITGTSSITKIVDNTSHGDTGTGSDSEDDLTIGEEVTYLLTVTLREGESDNVVVQDTLPSTGVSFAYVSSEIISIGSGITVGTGAVGTAGIYASGAETVTWNLGTVINPQGGGDTITFQIVARVEDVSDNVGTTTDQDANVVNTGTLTYDDVNGDEQFSNDPAIVDLVEPELSLAKARITTPNPFDAGDSIQYQITVTHTGDSTANAYDVEITDTLPLVGITFSQIDGGTCAVSDTDTSVVGEIIFTVDELTLNDASCTILYTVILGDDTEVGTTYTNTAIADYSTLPGTPDDDRTKSTNDDTADFETPSPSITKTVIGTSDAGNNDYAIGEVVTYHLVVSLPEGTIDNVVVSDTPPSGTAVLTPISMTVLGAADGTDIGITGVTVGASDTPDPLSINFGTLVNPAGGTNQIVIEVQARVTDDAANVGLVTD
ncbi:MAG: isopeptide-forming domain-containing fimbrial protein, partial [Chloroflexota bacterium]